MGAPLTGYRERPKGNPMLRMAINHAKIRMFCVGDPDNEVPLDQALEDLLKATAVRNPDFYEYENGRLRTAS
jgi:hypothetical protein